MATGQHELSRMESLAQSLRSTATSDAKMTIYSFLQASAQSLAGKIIFEPVTLHSEAAIAQAILLRIVQNHKL